MIFINWFFNAYAISEDCSNIVNFAIGINLNSKQPTLMNQMSINCCTTTGITCDINQRVVSIDFNNMGLDGYINGSAIPGTVTWLRLLNNNLSGLFPILPVALDVTDLRWNQLTGYISFPLPPNLRVFYISNNLLSGDIQQLPISLKEFQIDNNIFTGKLALNQPTILNIVGNFIIDIAIQDHSKLITCDLSDTPMLGNPHIISLTMCTQNRLYSPNVINVDFTDIMNLAISLGIKSKQVAIWDALEMDCCASSGIVCNSQRRIVQITWNSMGLNGTINGTSIPSALQTLNLNNNQIVGAIPTDFPRSITKLELENNQFLGNIPTTLPPDLTYLAFGGNRLTGKIPNSLPNNLYLLSLWGNKLSGSIPLNLPSGLVALDVSKNQMSGEIPSLPSTIQYLFLGHLGIPGNHFTGSLKLNRPLRLIINDNWITDVLIQDSSQLSSSNCDLSNNPLLGNLNIANLTMCTKNGLYSGTLLPNTKDVISSSSAILSLTSSTALYQLSVFKTLFTSETIYIPAESASSKWILGKRPTETNPQIADKDAIASIGDPILIYEILGGLFGLCILVFVARFVFRMPKIKSKYGRKNSFGTLNTVETKQTVRSYF